MMQNFMRGKEKGGREGREGREAKREGNRKRNQSFCTAKATINWVKCDKEGEIIFSNHTSDKSLIFNIHKEFNRKKQPS